MSNVYRSMVTLALAHVAIAATAEKHAHQKKMERASDGSGETWYGDDNSMDWECEIDRVAQEAEC